MSNEKWIKFFKVSPGGNTTILLDQKQVAPEDRAALAAGLMDDLSLGGEQVGFISWPCRKTKSGLETSFSIQMMGGEFCANAVRAYAGMLAFREGEILPWRGKIESSGIGGAINAYVTREGYIDAAIEVPLCDVFSISPLNSGETEEVSLDHGAVVRLPGITHILLPGIPDFADKPAIDADLMRSAQNWRGVLGLENEAAVGCIWFDLKKDALSMLPLVWVRDTDTTCLETSCGSGALALALFLGEIGGKEGVRPANDLRQNGVYSPPYASCTNFYMIMQPSGDSLWVSFNLHKSENEKGGRAAYSPENIWLGGPCRAIARGEVLVQGRFSNK